MNIHQMLQNILLFCHLFILFLVDNLLKTIIDLSMNPWIDLSSNSSQSSSRSLKYDVIKYYNLLPNQCMILGVVRNIKVQTAHIWPRCKGNTMGLFNLKNPVNCVRNCLRLTESIEKEFDRLSLTIIRDTSHLKVCHIRNTIIDLLYSIQ
jgi:hypothetical protein